MSKKELKVPIFPISCEVEAGKTYRWCGCGETKTEPFCDKVNCSKMIPYQASFTETVYFCACKETKDPPLCDGSHARLLREYLNQSKKA